MLALSDNAFALMAILSTFTLLRKLKQLLIKDSSLIGEIPETIGNLAELEELDLSNNNLTGIVAFDNNLSGELPNLLGNCSSLLIVQVNGNRLSGSISASLWTSTNLTLLMLSDNLFTGQLPRILAPSLSRLEISNNKLSGEIPTELSSWKNVTVFSTKDCSNINDTFSTDNSATRWESIFRSYSIKYCLMEVADHSKSQPKLTLGFNFYQT
ncbi:hypothetical protein TEA_000558 [Camellia sinensis var. sinensis]|uniref:Leucine-rich repeat-containing N-terminal plant-type domain-containing protein n=1 Tax=Camellia sinensis var. sinensis TaxID=542762 RepID=A0A4S4F2C2_CAMSN|nr:hypothetical protein TEA_000558 [Camellia sinensis var. sinensis]